MKITVSKQGKTFIVDPTNLPGSPRVGVGYTMMAALGDFLIGYQKELGLQIEVSQECLKTEAHRRAKAMRAK